VARLVVLAMVEKKASGGVEGGCLNGWIEISLKPSFLKAEKLAVLSASW